MKIIAPAAYFIANAAKVNFKIVVFIINQNLFKVVIQFILICEAANPRFAYLPVSSYFCIGLTSSIQKLTKQEMSANEYFLFSHIE